MAVYNKKVKHAELEFTLIASNRGLAPQIISTSQIDDKYMISMEMYPQTLNDVAVKYRDKYYQKIYDLVETLHKMGIAHGDLSEDNIVINFETGEVRLIDFGMSYLLDGREYLAEFEKQEVGFICGMRRLRYN